jgi:hypothetical protein
MIGALSAATAMLPAGTRKSAFRAGAAPDLDITVRAAEPVANPLV